MQYNQIDIIGKSYFRGFIFSIVVSMVIVSISCLSKFIEGPGRHVELTLEQYLKYLGGMWIFGIVIFVVLLFLTMAKVLGKRMADS